MEPIIAQTLGCIFDIDRVPGVLTGVGALVTLIGIFLITRGGLEVDKEKEEGKQKLVELTETGEKTNLI